MEGSALRLSEIQFRVLSMTGKVCCGMNFAACHTKITGGRSPSPYLRSRFKSPFSVNGHGPLPCERAQPRVHPVRATSVEDKGQEVIQSKTGVLKNSDGNIFDIFCYVFKLALGILSEKKQEYQELEEKIEHATDVVEEVAGEVQQVAKLTEEIAEKLENESAKDGMIYRSAKLVDKISEVVAKNAEIVENQAERVEEALKAVDKAVDNTEDAVDDIAKSLSRVGNDHGKSMEGEKSSIQAVEVKST